MSPLLPLLHTTFNLLFSLHFILLTYIPLHLHLFFPLNHHHEVFHAHDLFFPLHLETLDLPPTFFFVRVALNVSTTRFVVVA